MIAAHRGAGVMQLDGRVMQLDGRVMQLDVQDDIGSVHVYKYRRPA